MYNTYQIIRLTSLPYIHSIRYCLNATDYQDRPQRLKLKVRILNVRIVIRKSDTGYSEKRRATGGMRVVSVDMSRYGVYGNTHEKYLPSNTTDRGLSDNRRRSTLLYLFHYP